MNRDDGRPGDASPDEVDGPGATAASEDDRRWMNQALALAAQAGRRGEIPVAAMIVDRQGMLVGWGHNLRESLQDPTAHAEIVALRQAARRTGHWRLEGCTLYVTLEPCPMCAGALINSRVQRLVYGCADPKAGAVDSLYDLVRDVRFNHRLEVLAGVGAQEAAGLLRAFFARRRKHIDTQGRLG